MWKRMRELNVWVRRWESCLLRTADKTAELLSEVPFHSNWARKWEELWGKKNKLHFTSNKHKRAATSSTNGRIYLSTNQYDSSRLCSLQPLSMLKKRLDKCFSSQCGDKPEHTNTYICLSVCPYVHQLSFATIQITMHSKHLATLKTPQQPPSNNLVTLIITTSAHPSNCLATILNIWL